MSNKLQKATFAGGCFWCSEAVFRMLKGVESVTSGYAGGNIEDPTYEQVSAGNTGHKEAIQIEYDPDKISYNDLLEVFWTSHNPIQKGGQGNDIGPQYEAAIFYHTDRQKELAKHSKEVLQKKAYDEPIATGILPYKNFYPAEDYHQKYYKKNPNAGYCQIVINPKVEKVKKLFADKLKDGK
ncbi:MAG: peptide-methionine (S)-S-oxide reductase MsrA [Candidatus Spechtbacterales bacterium]|nr:peptide-methionine (S)-S-oxide reductase MsrA [Candidatus Spechtbacterales bacterium]